MFGWIIHRLTTLPVSLVALAAGLALANELGLARVPYFQRHWQVPHSWVAGRGVLPAVKWGVALGTGILTFVPYLSFFTGVLVAVWSGNPWVGCILGVAYGLGRAVPPLNSMWTGSGTRDLHLGYLRSRSSWRRILAFASAVIVAIAVSPGLT